MNKSDTVAQKMGEVQRIVGLNLMKAAGGEGGRVRLHGNGAELGSSPRKQGCTGETTRPELERPGFDLLHKRRFQSFCHTEKTSLPQRVHKKTQKLAYLHHFGFCFVFFFNLTVHTHPHEGPTAQISDDMISDLSITLNSDT